MIRIVLQFILHQSGFVIWWQQIKMNCKHRKNQNCRARRRFMIDMPELDAELQMVNTHIEHICWSNSESMQVVQ